MQVLTASNGYRSPAADLTWYQALRGQEGNTYLDRVYCRTEYIAQSRGLGHRTQRKAQWNMTAIFPLDAPSRRASRTNTAVAGPLHH